MKVLILYNELKNTCGVSKHLLYMLKGLKASKNIDFFILTGGGDSIDKFESLVKKVYIYPPILHANRTLKNFLLSLCHINKIVKKENIDIIHSHYHYVANLAEIVKFIRKVKAVQTVHALIDPIGRLNHFPSTYFITVNEHIYDHLVIKNKKLKQNVKLIRSGVPIPIYNSNNFSHKLKIISAGRLIPEKGFDIFIGAISKLDESSTDKAEFIIAGKGDYELELKKLADQLKTNVNFLGEIQDLNDQLSSTQIFVIASKSEGFPMALIEAAINKNLIISSNFFGHDSILKDNFNSLIFRVNDSSDLAEKLRHAIQNFENMNKIIKNGYEVFSQEFNLDNMISKTISFYKEILQ